MAKHRTPIDDQVGIYLSRKETADKLGITRLELWNITRQGQIRAHRLGGCIYYRTIDVEKLLKEC